MWPASSLKKPANKSSAGVKLGESLVDIGLLGERVHNLLVESGLPIARATLDSAGEQDSNLLGLQLAEGIPVFVRSMSSAIADQIGKALLMDAKTDAGFLPSITLADYLPKGVSIDANPEEKA
jgi:hypothetical protein|nr:MAG TPA: hypothetical protein [Caudoviricetes sp.]